MIRPIWSALAALLLALGWVLPAQAEEKILRYDSHVAIQKDGALDVIETITVRAEGNRIRHGIFREFPTRYKNRNGTPVRVGFELLGVTRDGQDEPAAKERMSNGVRIRIGRKDLFLDPGDYRYVIHYRTTRQLGHFPGYDELYWNVTGNGWEFPIDRAEATITLPSPAMFGQRAFYTGQQGASGKQARVVSERPGEIVFETTGPLAPYEGLTIAAAFPKGIVSPPGAGSKMGNFLADNLPPAVAIAGILGILGYYYLAWARAGRNPRAGTIVPLFSPSDNLSPAAMRYINKMGVDDRAVAAAIVDLGIRGKLRMEERDGGWFSRDKTWLIETDSDLSDVPEPEAALARELFSDGSELKMDKENHQTFSAAKAALEEELASVHSETLFKHNIWLAVLGILLIPLAGLLTAISYALTSGESRDVILSAASLLCFGLGALIYLTGPTKGVRAAAFVIAAVGAVVGGFTLPTAFSLGEPLWIIACLLPLPLAISAFWWIAAPTREGRAVMDRIAGFKQYLSIAERERLDRMTAPRDTPEIFEKYLPYAIALGVENRWADRFRGVLAAASAAGAQTGFAWYSGSHSPWDDAGGFVSDVGSSLASTVSSASTAPGSSSGSGGGGFSGGGGGGGGGGGW